MGEATIRGAMTSEEKGTFKRRAEEALTFAGVQVRRLITENPDYFPLFTQARKMETSIRVLDQLV